MFLLLLLVVGGLLFFWLSTVLLIIPAYNKALISNPARLKFEAFDTMVDITEIWKRIRATEGRKWGVFCFSFPGTFFFNQSGLNLKICLKMVRDQVFALSADIHFGLSACRLLPRWLWRLDGFLRLASLAGISTAEVQQALSQGAVGVITCSHGVCFRCSVGRPRC